MRSPQPQHPIRRLCAALLLIWWVNLDEADAFFLSSSNIIRPAFSSSPPWKAKKSIIVSSATRARTRCPINSEYSIIISLASSSSAADNNNKGNTNIFPQASPPFLSWAYALAAIMNVAAAMSLIWGSFAASNTSLLLSSAVSAASSSSSASYAAQPLLPSNYHYWDPTFTSSFLSYLLLGAGTCQLLSNITKHPPQQQHTHHEQQQLLLRQRLTFGTCLFSIIGLFSIPAEAFYHQHNQMKFATSFILCQLSKLFTATTSFIGWETTTTTSTTLSGGQGFGTSFSSRCKNILREIINGIQSTCKTLPITDTHPASFYRTLFIFVTLGNVVFNIPNLVFYLREGMSWFSLPVSLTVSSIGRVSLLSVILFVLKEEHACRSSRVYIDNDNDDVDGGMKKNEKVTKGCGTFVALNMMVGLWAVGVGISQGFVAGIPFNLRRAADKFLFGLLFLNNGILMQLTKMGWIKDRDEIDSDADPPLHIGL